MTISIIEHRITVVLRNVPSIIVNPKTGLGHPNHLPVCRTLISVHYRPHPKGEGYPHPANWGVPPYFLTRGTPILLDRRYPILPDSGVPHSSWQILLGGTPSGQWGVAHQLDGGTPIWLIGGTLCQWTECGTLLPSSGLDGGTKCNGWMGYPLGQDQMGVPPSGLDGGTPTPIVRR